MRLLSINVGQPRDVESRGEVVRTSIFKEPVLGRVRVRRLNIDGDQQSDLTVHGGVDKAVYVYPSEHYPFWREELQRTDLSWGAFGEKLTTVGLDETNMHIGDRLRVGSAELVVTQPRMPCYKLGIRFGRLDILKRLLQSERTGFYLAVTAEGDIEPGDPVEVIGRDPEAISVRDVVSLYASNSGNQDLLRRASNLPSLPQHWRHYFGERLA
jgi:MOSC domain-containing protein YiiM